MVFVNYPGDDPSKRLTYAGEMDGQGQRHGLGVVSWIDGSRYAGEWVADRPSGHGVQTYPDGSFYEGEFLDEQRQGAGSFTPADGNIRYCGEWAAGELDEAQRFWLPGPQAQAGGNSALAEDPGATPALSEKVAEAAARATECAGRAIDAAWALSLSARLSAVKDVAESDDASSPNDAAAPPAAPSDEMSAPHTPAMGTEPPAVPDAASKAASRLLNSLRKVKEKERHGMPPIPQAVVPAGPTQLALRKQEARAGSPAQTLDPVFVRTVYKARERLAAPARHLREKLARQRAGQAARPAAYASAAEAAAARRAARMAAVQRWGGSLEPPRLPPRPPTREPGAFRYLAPDECAQAVLAAKQRRAAQEELADIEREAHGIVASGRKPPPSSLPRTPAEKEKLLARQRAPAAAEPAGPKRNRRLSEQQQASSLHLGGLDAASPAELAGRRTELQIELRRLHGETSEAGNRHAARLDDVGSARATIDEQGPWVERARDDAIKALDAAEARQRQHHDKACVMLERTAEAHALSGATEALVLARTRRGEAEAEAEAHRRDLERQRAAARAAAAEWFEQAEARVRTTEAMLAESSAEIERCCRAADEAARQLELTERALEIAEAEAVAVEAEEADHAVLEASEERKAGLFYEGVAAFAADRAAAERRLRAEEASAEAARARRRLAQFGTPSRAVLEDTRAALEASRGRRAGAGADAGTLKSEVLQEDGASDDDGSDGGGGGGGGGGGVEVPVIAALRNSAAGEASGFDALTLTVWRAHPPRRLPSRPRHRRAAPFPSGPPR